MHVPPQRGISLECLGPQVEDLEFVRVVLSIVFVSEVGLVGYELHAMDAADAALYLVDDQCYQDYVDQMFVTAGIDVPTSYLPPLL